MASHRRSRSQRADVRSSSAEGKLYDLGAASRPNAKLKSNRSSRSSHYRIDTSQSHGSLSSSVGSNASAFKQNSISSGTLLRRKDSITHLVDPHLVEVPAKAIPQPPYTSIGVSRMAGMLDTDRSRSRRERTFIGGQCAACDELLEHTLSGERVLQFSCGHVAHEACLYEYIKDSESQYCPTCDAPLGLHSSRGGNILDLEKLSTMVRSLTQTPLDMPPARGSGDLSATWDGRAAKDDGSGTMDRFSRASMNQYDMKTQDLHMSRIERLARGSHSRSNSDNVRPELPLDARRHDYDLSAMESTVPVADSRNDIPYPKVTIRSEFPTVVRSSQQQSLTCLVTVEVPSSKINSRISAPPRPISFQRLSTAFTQPANQPKRPPPPAHHAQETQEILEAIADELKYRVDNWHGLEFNKFGPLRLHGTLKVGKDGKTWQELECYLFNELLICLKEKRTTVATEFGDRPKCSLKGSILVKRHLKDIQAKADDMMLTLNLSVTALPSFHLKFSNREQLELWQFALRHLDIPGPTLLAQSDEQDLTNEDDSWDRIGAVGRRSVSISSSHGSPRTGTTSTTDYSEQVHSNQRMPPSLHVPIDVVVVIPVSSSMQGLKIKLLQDTLRFLVSNLGDMDRMGLVTFGSNGGAMSMVGMTTKHWSGWTKTISSIRPIGQKSLRADSVEGASVAMDLLMQRKGANSISGILLISDSPTCDSESVDFVVQRAEAARVGIYSFGLGQTHKPENLIELSARTRASYVYVKDWMMIRDCVAGCLGSLQSTSQLSAKLRLKLPEGSPAKIAKVSGALQMTKRTKGRDAEAIIGDLRFGDKRDILIQLTIDPDTTTPVAAPQDHWESIVSGLEALSGALDDSDAPQQTVEEVPLIQANLSFGDLGREGSTTYLSRPSLLTITMLPEPPKSRGSKRRSTQQSIPPHPSIVQRRMELLTSDMLTRALTLVSRGQHERAEHLLNETRSILQGLAKGSLPPLPSAAPKTPDSPRKSIASKDGTDSPRSSSEANRSTASEVSPSVPRAACVDQKVMSALNADIDSSLEYINHPAVFAHDARKAALQAIGVISSQRGYAFRTASEGAFAGRIPGIKRLADASREWRASGDDILREE